ncbi:MAG: RNA 2',3'-cyclic phosphodiesterase [Pseudomonadota bacterium]
MIRLFVGIALAEDVTQRLVTLQHGVPEARWIEPQNLHLTLRFIGPAEEPQAQDIHDALDQISAAVFPITWQGMGYFAAGKRPRSLWVGVADNPALDYLQSKVERALQKAGLEPETRRFTPHVTLGRVSQSPLHRLDHYVADHDGCYLPSMRVDRFTLFQSHLGKAQADYQAVVDYPLIGAMMWEDDPS